LEAGGKLTRQVVRHWDLTWELTKRELTERYARHAFGALWAVAHPVLLMGVYMFIYAKVLKIRLGEGMPGNYTVYLLTGLVPWLCCSDVLNKSASVLTANANLVKQVVFPVELLAVKGVLASLVTQALSSVALLLYAFYADGFLPWTWCLFPIVFIFNGVALVGVACLLSVVRDFVQIGCTIGVFFAPIVYLPDMVPPAVRPLLYLNPFSYVAWCFQDVCFFGRIAHPWAWAVLALGALGVGLVGAWVFRKLKPMLGSAL
jgi:lipopolysaccharide transport system permease protein